MAWPNSPASVEARQLAAERRRWHWPVMGFTSGSWPRPRQLDAAAEQLAFAACLVLPLTLLYARAAAEILIPLIGALFLIHSWNSADWRWAGRPFALAAGLWWVWVVACSAINMSGIGMAMAAIRLPLLALAVGYWVLAPNADFGTSGSMARLRLLWMAIALSCLWIGLESWQQYLTGRNIFGQPRFGDGALTGPFNRPRAGPAFILVFFPAVVPTTMELLRRGWRWAAYGVVAMAALTTILIGQRMPTMLMVLGMAVVALLLPRLRWALAGAVMAGGLLLAATPIVSPATYGKLVVQFSDQMRHFSQSAYGLIYVRAGVIAEQHPWVGLGFDGFKRGCGDAGNMRGLPLLGIPDVLRNGGMEACNIHPHNYYLEAADNAGVAGLLLFIAMAAAALVCLLKELEQPRQPLLIGIFTGVFIALFPIASTSAFTSMPNGGWIFLVLGLGFAVARQSTAADITPLP